MNNKGERETGSLASVWYGEPFEEEDEDAIDIRPRRQRGSVRSGPKRPAAEYTEARGTPAPSGEQGDLRQRANTPSAAPNAPRPAESQGQRAVSGAARPQSGQVRSAQNAAPRRQSSIPPERTKSARSIPARSGSRGEAAQSRAARTSSSRRRKSRVTVGCVIRRTLLVIFTVVFFAAGCLLAVANTLANGPSETARNKAVMSALQASATKWAPGLFLSDEVVDQILADSQVVVTDVKPITDVAGGEEGDAPSVIPEDRWEKAIDGMIYETVNGKTFKGYVLLIKDPSRVSVAISDESFATASRIFEIADQYGAIAAINGGEFPDNGVKTGANPIGLTYAQGKCVWDDGLRRTFIGFTEDNKLYVEEGTTREAADAAGIRDAVAFQTGNTLITNDGENVTYYYADSNTGVAQRTGIGQLADGTVIFLVTDGRTASSMGATKNDIIDVFADYGAITAGLLDGGSSAMLYYRNWYDKYNIDRDQLDEWQLMGLVNRYKAFTNPRQIPTFFIVK